MAPQDTRNQTPEHEPELRLPAFGYPISEYAVTHWFQQTYQRPPTDHEVGAILDAMAQREATPPHDGPNSEPQGWALDASVATAGRR